MLIGAALLLGWSPGGDREIMPWSEMEPLFDVSKVNSSSAFFDEKKLRAFNGEYIRALPVEEFIRACGPWLSGERAPWNVKKGDEVIFASYAGTEVKIDGEELMIMSEDDILAVVE